MTNTLRANCLALGLWAAAAAPAAATFCAADAVPAATLLLPYFEVDLDDPNGVTTLFSINNALPSPGLVHVTLWSDWGIPTLDFDVYLTGYDVQTFNLRDVFNGHLPATADDLRDPSDTISPRGWASEDGDFPGCAVLPYVDPVLSELLRLHLRNAHTGLRSPVYGRCVGQVHTGAPRARGYLTADAVRSCSVAFPSDSGYFEAVAARENRLWGTVTYVDPANNAAQQETLVHIEACDPGEVGQPCSVTAANYTFYGSLVGFDGSDAREPLGSRFASSYLNGGAFTGGTKLMVWRDTQTPPGTGSSIGTDCSAAARPSWMPLPDREVLAFDEQENGGGDLCGRDDVLPSPPFDDVCFPLATQRVPVGGTEEPTFPARWLVPPADFGWLQLDLNHGTAGSAEVGRAQAWVTTVTSAQGRFSTAADAIRLESACGAAPTP